MDRLAIAGIALGLVIGAVGLARGHDALAMRAQAAMAEARVTAAQRDVERLRSLPPDRYCGSGSTAGPWAQPCARPRGTAG